MRPENCTTIRKVRSDAGAVRHHQKALSMTDPLSGSPGLLARACVCAMALSISAVATAADTAAAHWTYSGDTGPTHWGGEDPAFVTCGTGKHQSPIDIESTVIKDLPALRFEYTDTPLDVTDTGHSFQINAAPGSGEFSVGNDRYHFVQIHFHDSSEEKVHGQYYSMEAHLVHANAKGELAVVAVLIREGRTNEFLKPIFDGFPQKGSTEHNVIGKSINIENFLPAHRGYFSFDGSLTTPPCSEHVRWFVLKTPVEASAEQLQQFAVRYPHNNRPTQPINGRVIVESRTD
jgi:carbonic anhydrase